MTITKALLLTACGLQVALFLPCAWVASDLAVSEQARRTATFFSAGLLTSVLLTACAIAIGA